MDQALLRYMIQSRDDENFQACISTSSFTMAIQIVVVSFIFFIFNIFYRNQYSLYVYLNVLAMLLSGYMLQTARGLGDSITLLT